MTGTDTPVLVAGAGAAGTVAALRLTALGVPSILIDASPVFPASASIGMAAGMIPAAGTRLQGELGIRDDPALFAEDIQRKASWEAPGHLVTSLTHHSALLVDWLIDEVGIALELVTDFVYPGHSVPRCHAMPDRNGSTLHAALLSAVRAETGIELIHPLRLAALSLSDDVFECHVTTPDGQADQVRADAVMLCSGGFGAARELVRQHIPDAVPLDYHGGEGSTGDALRIAKTHGLDLAYLDSYQGHGSLSYAGVPLTWAAVVHAGFLVNSAGHRFGNEMRGYSEFASLTALQPGATAWVVFDSMAERELMRSHDFRVLRAAGQVVTASGAADLAARLGADAPALSGELDAIAAARSTPDRFGRTWDRVPGPDLRAVRVRGALFHTQGGIVVDEYGRAQRNGSTVSRVYAAGGAATGISGHGAAGYLAGNGLLSAMGLAFIGADHLASTPCPQEGD